MAAPRLIRIAVFSTLLLALVSPAVAQTARSVDALKISGKSSDHASTIVGGAIENVLRKAGWQLPEKADKSEPAALSRCLTSDAPASCITTKSGIKGLQRLLSVSIAAPAAATGTANPSAVVLTGRLFVNAEQPLFVTRQRYCDSDADVELIRSSEDLAKDLIAATSGATSNVVLAVKSIPTAAKITLDGKSAGTTEAKLNTSAGEHQLFIEQPGYLPETLAITLTQDITTVTVSLHAIPSPFVANKDPGATNATLGSLVPPKPIAPYALAGTIVTVAGTALVAFGAVSIYVDAQAGPMDKYSYSRATTVGVVTGTIGLAAVATGIYLLLKRSEETGPAITPSSTGTTLGWRGTF